MIPVKAYIAAGALVAIVAGVWLYGNARFNAGVRKTAAEYLAADKQGTETVHETTRKALAGIGDDADPDSLLESTDGFRD